MENVIVWYIFTLADGSKVEFDLPIGGKDFRLQGKMPDVLPNWARLDFQQCHHCPLTVAESPYCPLAANIVGIVEGFGSLVSYDPIHVDVVTEERSISQDTTAQQAISSLMGLVIATCGCPHTAFLKPMARFHLPLASEAETIYRATSMYMLAQYYIKQHGGEPDFDLKGLTELYKNVQEVNLAIADRLRVAVETDSSVNAIILLDMYAKVMPFAVKESLEELKHLFQAYV
jgi:hypothetical protein